MVAQFSGRGDMRVRAKYIQHTTWRVHDGYICSLLLGWGVSEQPGCARRSHGNSSSSGQVILLPESPDQDHALSTFIFNCCVLFLVHPGRGILCGPRHPN